MTGIVILPFQTILQLTLGEVKYFVSLLNFLAFKWKSQHRGVEEMSDKRLHISPVICKATASSASNPRERWFVSQVLLFDPAPC